MEVTAEDQRRAAVLEAAPNPVPAGLDLGSTTITWDMGDGSIGQIYVSRENNSEDLLTTGSIGSVDFGWIAEGSSYLFRLYEGTTHERVVAEVTVTRCEMPRRAAILEAAPNPVPAGLDLGSTTITWDMGDGSIGQIYVSRENNSEDLLTTGSIGSVDFGWIAEGSSYLFRLYEGTTHERVVAEVTVTRRGLSWEMLSEEVIRYASRDEHADDVAELLSKLLPRYAYPPAYQRYFRFWKQHGYVSAHPDRFAGISYLTGECNVCGRHSAFFSDNVGLYREALTCAECLTTSRYRSVARGLLRAIRELTGVQAESLSELSQKQGMRRLSVYDTQVPFYAATNAYPIPDILSRCSWIDTQVSAYMPSYPWGTSLDQRTSNQNLERLSFPDNSFDIVITSDVMEHVRLDADAHSEIRRVLKPGGVYIFTVPHFRHQRETLARVTVTEPSDPSKDIYSMEKEYHGDANSEEDRALVYRVYGTDLDEALTRLGFEVEYEKRNDPQHAIMNTELFYCRLSKQESM